MCDKPRPMFLMVAQRNMDTASRVVVQVSLAALEQRLKVMEETGAPIGDENFHDLLLTLLRTKAFDPLDDFDAILVPGDHVLILCGMFCEGCSASMELEWSGTFDITTKDMIPKHSLELIKFLEGKSGMKITPIKFTFVNDALVHAVEREMEDRVRNAMMGYMATSGRSRKVH